MVWSTGKLPLREYYWQWLATLYPRTDKVHTYNLLNLIFRSLELKADIHLLSNPCQEWLVPMLNKAARYTKSITITNQVGFCKSDHEIYEIVEKQMDNKGAVLYIDNQEKNFKPTKELGWDTLADQHHKWIEEINIKLMNSNRE